MMKIWFCPNCFWQNFRNAIENIQKMKIKKKTMVILTNVCSKLVILFFFFWVFFFKFYILKM
jgi:uncharacterized protein (DUF2225 family)